MNNLLLDNPLYFYALIPNPEGKRLDTEPGLMTPQYLFDHDKNYLFDPIIEPWRRIIVNKWMMYQQDPATLTRREVIDALNIKLGPEFMNSIQFFRYVPSPTLGWQLKLVMLKMAIFRIDLNDTAFTKYVHKEDIDWGRDEHIASRKLNRMYYQQLTYEEFTKYYKDNIPVMNKDLLLNQFNRISIKPEGGFIPKTVCEDMTRKLALNNPFIGGKM